MAKQYIPEGKTLAHLMGCAECRAGYETFVDALIRQDLATPVKLRTDEEWPQ